MIIAPISIDWTNATENLLTTGTIKGLSGTFTGLTPAGFVKNSITGLLSTEAPGTATYIPYSSGTGFSYITGFTFDGSALKCPGKFSTNGNAAPPVAGNDFSVTQNSQSSIGILSTNSNNYNAGNVLVGYGIQFGMSWRPTVGSASNRSQTILYGGFATVGLLLDATETKNFTATTMAAFTSVVTLTSATTGGGVVTATNLMHFRAPAPTLNTNSICTHNYAFYDAGQYINGTKTPDAWGCAINTQSYFNANVRIGSAVAPTVALDVTGAALISTTLGVTGLSTLTGGISSGNIEPIADDTYYLGKNDDDAPKAWKGIILKDQTDGKYYRIELNSGAISIVDLTD